MLLWLILQQIGSELVGGGVKQIYRISQLFDLCLGCLDHLADAFGGVVVALIGCFPCCEALGGGDDEVLHSEGKLCPYFLEAVLPLLHAVSEGVDVGGVVEARLHEGFQFAFGHGFVALQFGLVGLEGLGHEFDHFLVHLPIKLYRFKCVQKCCVNESSERGQLLYFWGVAVVYPMSLKLNQFFDVFDNHIQMSNEREAIRSRFRELQEQLGSENRQGVIARGLEETAIFLQQIDIAKEVGIATEVYEQLRGTVKALFAFLQKSSGKQNTLLGKLQEAVRRLLLGVSQFCSCFYRVYHPLGCGVMIREFLSSECRLFVIDRIAVYPEREDGSQETGAAKKQETRAKKQWANICTFKTEFFSDCVETIMRNLCSFHERFGEMRLDIIGQYLRLLYYMDDYLIKAKLQTLVKINIESLQQLCVSPTKEIMTNASKQSLDEIIEYGVKLLRSVREDEFKRRVHMLGAQLGLSMIGLSSIEKKLVGCKILSKYSYEIFYHSSVYVSEVYYAEWVVQHHFFELIFQQHCQSSLIKASEDTFKLLVKRGMIQKQKFRRFFLILEKADSDLRKAMFRLIEPFRVDFYQIEAMLEIFKTIRGIQFYDDQFFYFLEGLSRYSTETQLKNTLAVVQSILGEHYLKFETYMVRKRAVECYAYVFQRLLTYKQPEERMKAYSQTVAEFLAEPNESRLIMIKSLFESMTETKMELYYQQRLSIVIIDEMKFIQQSLSLFGTLPRNKGDLISFIRLALKRYKRQGDTSLSRETLREGVGYPEIFQEMLELTRDEELQDLLGELVGLSSSRQVPFCCIKWVFIRLNRRGLRAVKKQYTEMIATHATVENPSTFVGLGLIQLLVYSSQSQAVRRGACELLAEIYTNFADDFREEGELYLVEFLKETIVTIDTKFQQFFSNHISSTAMLGTLQLMQQLMLQTEYFGVSDLRAHNSQVPTSTMLLKIYNNVTYGDDVLKIFQKKFPSNRTLFEVIVEVAKQFKIGPLDMGLQYPSNLSIRHNGLTLEELKLNNQELNAFRLPQSRVKKEPLLVDGEVGVRAKQVFTDMFHRFAPNGRMGKKECGNYIEAVTIGYCPIYDSRISSLFAEYDTDKDQALMLQDFLRFYRDSLFDAEKAEAVQKNLNNLRYRRDLRLFDEPMQFNRELLFRYYIWANNQIYEYLFRLSHQADPALTALAQRLLLRLPTYSKISQALTDEIDLRGKSSFQVQYLLAALQNQLRDNRQKSSQFIRANNHESIFQQLCLLSAKQVRLESDQSCLVICLHILRSLLGIDNLKTISLRELPVLACSFRKTDVFVKIIREGVKQGDSNLLQPAFALQLTQSQLPVEWIEEASFSRDKDTRILTCNFLFLWLLKGGDRKLNLFDLQIGASNNEEWFNLLTSITKIDGYDLDLHGIFASKIAMLSKCEQSLERDRFNPIIHGNLKIMREIYAKLTSHEKTVLNQTLCELLPKLISNQNRSLVYDLRLIDDSSQLLADLQVISRLKITKEMQPRNNYVGIRNLGSICYMNSILQQFFMIKQFYNMVMGLQSATEVVEIKEVRLVDDFLAQLQEMYIHLACSQKQYYDPTKFCLSVKDAQNNPINVNVQQDAHEFLNAVFGKIQEYAKKQEKLSELQRIFGGKTVTEITCLSCHNKNEVTEHFYHLSIEVNGMTTLPQSFSKLIQSEEISDYFCEHCNRKVEKISKQMLIKQSPEILIINLQRIIFDLETFLKVKVHTRFQFQQTLDLHNYFSSSNKPAPYELKGVVIHAGTSQGGHYYSLIKMEGKWYKFNDQTVTVFNESDLGREAFGGEENTDQWGDLTSSTNAYILFYQKTKRAEEEGHELPAAETSHPLRQKVLESNREFAMELKFNQPSFFAALHNLCCKQVAALREGDGANMNRLWSVYLSVFEHLTVTATVKLQVINQVREDMFILLQQMPLKRVQLLARMNANFATVKHNLCLHNDAVYRDLYEKILGKALSYVFSEYKQLQNKQQIEGRVETQLINKLCQLSADQQFLNNILKSSQYFQLWKSLAVVSPATVAGLFLLNDVNRLLEILMGSECTVAGKKRQDLPHSQAISLVELVNQVVKFCIEQNRKKREAMEGEGDAGQSQMTLSDSKFVNNPKFYNKIMRDKLDRGLLGPIIRFKAVNNRQYSQFIIEVLLRAMNGSDQLYDKNIVFSNIQVLLQIEDGFSRERMQWILGVPQLESIKFDGFQFGMITSSESQVYGYSSPVFFKDENCKPYLSALYEKRKYFNAFSIYGIINLLSLVNERRSIRDYVLSLPPPSYSHKTYTDWIETYTIRLKHEEHYSLPAERDVLYEQINSLMTAYKDKIKNELSFDQLPVNRLIIGKNCEFTLLDSVKSELCKIQLWSHLTYVLKNRPYGIGNFQLPDDEFSFGSTKTNLSRYFLKSVDEQPKDEEGVSKQLTMLTFTVKPLSNLSVKFKMPQFDYTLYLVQGKHYSVNCPYQPGAIADLIEVEQTAEREDRQMQLQQQRPTHYSEERKVKKQVSGTGEQQYMSVIEQQPKTHANLGVTGYAYDYGDLAVEGDLSDCYMQSGDKFKSKNNSIPSPLDYQLQVNCKICTYINSVSNMTCEMCGNDLR